MRILIENDELAETAIAAAHAARPELRLERLDIHPAHRGFGRFVNDGTIDLGELAIVTLLQALAHGRPLVLLPVTAVGRHQHQTLVTCQDRGLGEIAGATVGIRSWSQTTGVWMRGILAHEYGIDLRSIDWVVFEAGHVPAQPDPGWVRRAPATLKLETELLAGRLDYAIFGNERPSDPRVRAAIPEAESAAARYAQRERFIPVNHVLATTVATARAAGDALCAIFDALAGAFAADAAKSPDVPSAHPVGFEALRAPFTRLAQYAHEQELLPRPVEFDELVARSCEALGVPPSRLNAPSVPGR